MEIRLPNSHGDCRPRRARRASATILAVSTILTRADLTRADVERIARLAHLELTESEAEQFTRQLGDILAYFERLNRLDTTGVEATTHPVTSAPVMRADELRPSMPVDDTFGNAPDRGGSRLFRVPKVIG